MFTGLETWEAVGTSWADAGILTIYDFFTHPGNFPSHEDQSLNKVDNNVNREGNSNRERVVPMVFVDIYTFAQIICNICKHLQMILNICLLSWAELTMNGRAYTGCNRQSFVVASFALLNKYIWPLGQIFFAILNKYIFIFGQICLAIDVTASHLSLNCWTNTSYNIDKYFLLFRQIHLAIGVTASHSLSLSHHSVQCRFVEPHLEQAIISLLSPSAPTLTLLILLWMSTNITSNRFCLFTENDRVDWAARYQGENFSKLMPFLVWIEQCHFSILTTRPGFV